MDDFINYFAIGILIFSFFSLCYSTYINYKSNKRMKKIYAKSDKHTRYTTTSIYLSDLMHTHMLLSKKKTLDNDIRQKHEEKANLYQKTLKEISSDN